jgi:hypothetical protein
MQIEFSSFFFRSFFYQKLFIFLEFILVYDSVADDGDHKLE